MAGHKAIEKGNSYMGYLQQIRGIMALGYSLNDACKGLGISEHVYYRWVHQESVRLHKKHSDASIGSIDEISENLLETQR